MKPILLSEYRRKTPRAMKTYVCAECLGAIARGEHYARYMASRKEKGVNLMHEVFRCQHCDVLAKRINETTPDNPVLPEELASRVTANPEWRTAFDENATRRTKGKAA